MLRESRRPTRHSGASAATVSGSRRCGLSSLLATFTVAGVVSALALTGVTSTATANIDSPLRISAPDQREATDAAASLTTDTVGAQRLDVMATGETIPDRAAFEAITLQQRYSTYSQSSVPCAVSGDGTLRWPLTAGCTISSGYGYRIDPSYGTSAFHNGVDLTPGRGAAVIAAAAGVVVAVEHDTWGYGTHVIIEHPQLGVSTLYGHMIVGSTSHLRVGQQIAVGDLIGKVGSTGKSTGSHLHFEIRVPDGAGGHSTVDPLVWMDANIRKRSVPSPAPQAPGFSGDEAQGPTTAG